MKFDEASQIYFDKKIKQVFVYLTNRCQLRCKQCLYKPLLCNSSDDIDFQVLRELVIKFREFGAYKISFLGGEPTLYQDTINSKSFGDIVKMTKDVGYTYVRVDTNGQFDSSFLSDSQIQQLDEITFSLDGHNEETNDVVRGKGSYRKCVNNIKEAVKLGYKVQITSCVHKYSCPTSEIGVRNIKQLIAFAKSIGVYSINFHPILKVSIPRDAWIDNTNIQPDVWKSVYDELINTVRFDQNGIKVRLPMRFIDEEKILANRNEYFYCPLEMGERALIMPDGQIKVCAFTIGIDRCIARYNSKEVIFEKKNSELPTHKLTDASVCYNQGGRHGNLVPLCMSYKPFQSEIVWESIKNG